MTKASAKKTGKPDYVTPEYIAAQRAKRQLAKAERAKRNAELGIVPQEQGFDCRFVERPMLRVAEDDDGAPGIVMKIMTYNVLGQALIRRKLFPTNGNALKWRWRSRVLLSELRLYDADIMCLQEVDKAQLEPFYFPELEKLGYTVLFHCGQGKNHGLLLCWRTSMFCLDASKHVDYDDDSGYDADGAMATGKRHTVPQTRTRNVALLAALRYVNSTSNAGVIVGTTHLFWHPYGTLERTRQCAVLVRNLKKFSEEIDPTHGQWPIFAAGDFNSLPFDAPYLCMTQPQERRVTARSKTVLENSFNHVYTTKDEEEVEEDEDDVEGVIFAAEEVKSKVDSVPAPKALVSSVDTVILSQFTPQTSMPPPGEPTRKSISREALTIDDVYTLHDNNNSVILRSLYGSSYRYAHPENSSVDDRNGEPSFSNWAHSWRGLLDYIFVFDHRPGASSGNEGGANVEVLELLRLPLPDEMGAEPSGQPREGQYPSDHLCLMAKIKIVQ
ncbi:Endonuclease/exonuclease/phosphatase [Limtongia smithiae]|uniref:Endonuclease/exonuclease/phosphatase n=1 Tax=Limtongia smithiae TaxID=1125753 RepID=UPI0034D00672